MDKKITLISGPNCHLCDQAKQLLYPLLEANNIQLKELNVKDDVHFSSSMVCVFQW